MQKRRSKIIKRQPVKSRLVNQIGAPAEPRPNAPRLHRFVAVKRTLTSHRQRKRNANAKRQRGNDNFSVEQFHSKIILKANTVAIKQNRAGMLNGRERDFFRLRTVAYRAKRHPAIKTNFLNTNKTDFYTDGTVFFEFAGTRKRKKISHEERKDTKIFLGASLRQRRKRGNVERTGTGFFRLRNDAN